MQGAMIFGSLPSNNGSCPLVAVGGAPNTMLQDHLNAKVELGVQGLVDRNFYSLATIVTPLLY